MANPKWFNAEVYAANKLDQLKVVDAKGNWTAESLTKAFEEAGYKGEEGLYQHFLDYGMNENVSPNAAFDVDFYLAAKADQLNKEQPGANWTVNKVYEAIQAAGMNVWQHYELYGSQEGVATSADFDSEKYFSEKTRLMNETKEDGRSDWSVAEVKAAFEAAGLSALEHYNEYGKAEFESAGKTADLNAAIKADPSITTDSHFNPYTGVQTYNTLVDALKAQKEGTLAEKYAITSTADAGTVTVAQQAGLADLLAGATPASSVTPTYFLTDTVAALADASTIVLTGSNGGYDVADTLANAVAGADGLVNGANAVNATVAFGAKAATAKTDADVITTELKWDDLDGKADGHITLVRAEGDKAEGNAEIAITAATTAKALGTSLADMFNVDDTVDAFADTSALTQLSFSFTATEKDDFLQAGSKVASVNGGAGNDFIQGSTDANILIGGDGADFIRGDVYAFGEGATGTGDILFAGAKTELVNGVYAAGSDSNVNGHIAPRVKDLFGAQGEDEMIKAMSNANILEGREGDDTLVASTAKDIFFYQVNNVNDAGAKELTSAQLGHDTIHSFQFGTDKLMIVDTQQSLVLSATESLKNGGNEWSGDLSSVTAVVNGNKVTVTIDGDWFAGENGEDLVIDLVGVIGLPTANGELTADQIAQLFV